MGQARGYALSYSLSRNGKPRECAFNAEGAKCMANRSIAPGVSQRGVVKVVEWRNLQIRPLRLRHLRKPIYEAATMVAGEPTKPTKQTRYDHNPHRYEPEDLDQRLRGYFRELHGRFGGSCARRTKDQRHSEVASGNEG
jgi:hypothetical protein